MKTNFLLLLILSGLAGFPGSSWGSMLTTTQRPLTSASVPAEKALVLTVAARTTEPAESLSPTGPSRMSTEPAVAPSSWTAEARLRHGLGSVAGTLRIDTNGIEFESPKNTSLHWPFVEIQTLDLSPRRLIITSYEKGGRYRPGVRRYRFDLSTEMPSAVAAQLAREVGKPVRNGNPEPDSPAIATIPARHRSGFGGTISNGVLRFGKAGIEYITPTTKDSRSWRWADIQTLSGLDSYRFVLFGHRETYTFDLKKPMARSLLDRLTDEVYAHSVNGPHSTDEAGQ